MSRWFKLEPALVGSAVAAVYIAAAMLYRALVDHSGVFQPDLLVAAVMAVYGVVTRVKVTPVALPRDNAGRALTPSQQPAAVPTTPVQPPPAAPRPGA